MRRVIIGMAAAFIATVSAAWGYDWASTDGEPRIFCSQQVTSDGKAGILKYSTDPAVDSPPATIMYDCLFIANTMQCNLKGSFDGGTYKLSGENSSVRLSAVFMPEHRCFSGYKYYQIRAVKNSHR